MADQSLDLPSTSGSGGRPFFWAGFVAGLLLLTLVTCGILAAAMGLSRQTLTALQSNEIVWTPPPVQPTATPAPITDAGRFAALSWVRNVTNSRVNLRRTPGYLGKTDEDVLLQTRPGDRMEILGDRAQADGLVWWRIRYTADDGRAIEGWVAEATASGVQILGAAQAP